MTLSEIESWVAARVAGARWAGPRHCASSGS